MKHLIYSIFSVQEQKSTESLKKIQEKHSSKLELIIYEFCI